MPCSAAPPVRIATLLPVLPQHWMPHPTGNSFACQPPAQTSQMWRTAANAAKCPIHGPAAAVPLPPQTPAATAFERRHSPAAAPAWCQAATAGTPTTGIGRGRLYGTRADQSQTRVPRPGACEGLHGCHEAEYTMMGIDEVWKRRPSLFCFPIRLPLYLSPPSWQCALKPGDAPKAAEPREVASQSARHRQLQAPPAPSVRLESNSSKDFDPRSTWLRRQIAGRWSIQA